MWPFDILSKRKLRRQLIESRQQYVEEIVKAAEAHGVGLTKVSLYIDKFDGRTTHVALLCLEDLKKRGVRYDLEFFVMTYDHGAREVPDGFIGPIGYTENPGFKAKYDAYRRNHSKAHEELIQRFGEREFIGYEVSVKNIWSAEVAQDLGVSEDSAKCGEYVEYIYVRKDSSQEEWWKTQKWGQRLLDKWNEEHRDWEEKYWWGGTCPTCRGARYLREVDERQCESTTRCYTCDGSGAVNASTMKRLMEPKEPTLRPRRYRNRALEEAERQLDANMPKPYAGVHVYIKINEHH